ncbi:hypothetical protein SAMN00120144_0710 [Hymenobacter roseosalivarius DSM 11622]|uniref:Uncharacterized protein n=1 Tax=Hymenobacter roseosalivarius DSM 11622 TaxID=645990 RepID=A0A1W1UQZ4_9BACT|nr:hypothetical protein SAMN00120144_0710 [Hymenobacter roseosalivarius DSM 11622]
MAATSECVPSKVLLLREMKIKLTVLTLFGQS